MEAQSSRTGHSGVKEGTSFPSGLSIQFVPSASSLAVKDQSVSNSALQTHSCALHYKAHTEYTKERGVVATEREVV